MELEQIAKNFQIKGSKITKIEKYGNGHINTTYLVEVDANERYILQKINNNIFKDVPGFMNNIALVTDYLKEDIKARGGDIYRETLTVVPTLTNDTYFHDVEDDTYYRTYIFIEDTVTLEAITCKEEFRLLGETFANFANILNGFDSSKLIEVIPNFHNTKSRYDHLWETVKVDAYDRVKNVKEELEFVKKHQDKVSIIVNAINNKEIPLRVTHNDTKLNNVLFDKSTMAPICVIDLDTIMPGSTLYDFGDSIRFGCNPSGEDEVDLSKVIFNIEYFKAYAEGYIKAFGDKLTPKEKELLPLGAILMTLECGIRFLDDYLDGEHYFHVKYEGNDLVRARTQFHLVKQMEENLDLLNSIVKSI